MLRCLNDLGAQKRQTPLRKCHGLIFLQMYHVQFDREAL